MGGNVIVGIKSIAKLFYMMNEDGNKDRFVKENKIDYNVDSMIVYILYI